MNEPVRDRPGIPATYGIKQGPDGMLEWGRVTAAVDSSDIYWVATKSRRGAPHLVPIHSASIGGVVHLSGDPSTKWYRNLADDPTVQVGIDHGGLQVMVRGAARLDTPSPQRWSEMNANLATKYEWQLDGEPLPVWVVRPHTVIAFNPAEFADSPTRFSFEDSP